MAPRTSARALASSSSSTPVPVRAPPPIAQPVFSTSPHVLELRRQWKWAAVGQFFFTFSTLLALDDVTITDIENDLLNSTMIVLPRLMQRLLVTLTQDRKTNLDNWQSTLRRQYTKRDPLGNPIGPEPLSAALRSRGATAELERSFPPSEVDVKDQHEAPADGFANVDRPDTKDVVNAHPEAQGSSNSKQELNDEVYAEGIVGEEKKDAKVVDGTSEELLVESKDWAELPMLEKLQCIHTVMEWHFQNPLRLRGLMKSDDENASWRIEPIGYDSKRNAYWLIGHDRLWLQRQLPAPPKKKQQKRKTDPTKKAKVKLRLPPSNESKQTKYAKSNARTLPKSAAQAGSISTRNSRNKADPASLSPSANGIGRARAAKTQANAMLEEQAKQLLAVKAEMRSLNRSKNHREVQTPIASPRRPTLGTRVSRRLRGKNDGDDEWQELPDEWLSEGNHLSEFTVQNNAKRKLRQKDSPQRRRRGSEDGDDEYISRETPPRKTGLDADDSSELTELSDMESVINEEVAHDHVVSGTAVEEENGRGDDGEEELPEVWPPHDFVEWETICVTLEDWEGVAKRFEGSKNYLEKALYKILSQEIVPYVTETLRELERQRAKEEALMSRKRSSRIAIKETEKEAVRHAAQLQAEEDERTARARRQEARARKEEEERQAREQARELRRREREERELARAKRHEWSASKDEEMEVDAEKDELRTLPDLPHTNGQISSTAISSIKEPRRRAHKKKDTKSKSSSEDWELDCEICGSKGSNRDDGVPLMCCEVCSRWQHIPCHDADDDRHGRPRRDWDKVDFMCQNCRSKRGKTVNGLSNGSKRAQMPLLDAKPDDSSSRVFLKLNPHPSLHNHNYHSHSSHPTPAFPDQPPFSTVYPARSIQEPMVRQSTAYTSNSSFAHYQPQQRAFASHPSSTQPQQHQTYYGQPQYSLSTTLNGGHLTHPSVAPYNHFPGPLQLPPPSNQSANVAHQSNSVPSSIPFRYHYPQSTSGPTPYYQAPSQQ